MCIAICKPENITIPTHSLEESFKRNPDGAGFAYAENETLHIQKGFMTFDEFYSAYQPHESKAAAIHFRIKTHGNVDQENTHPFQVGRNLAVIHNGIINSIDCSKDKTKSDTYWFNQSILVPIYKRDSRFIFKEHFKELIKEYIGWSKLVFLNNKGHYSIVNEDKGHWDEGVWYSNTSYQVKKVQENKRITPVTQAANQELFVMGSRVRVEYEFNKKNNGEGVIQYFAGGQMVGIKMDGQTESRLIHMSFVHPITDTPTFIKDDWVVRKDNQDLIGEVQGMVGTGVVIHWLNAMGAFAGPSYVVSADKLQYWWAEAN